MSDDNGQDVTALLVDWSNGDEAALEKLMPLVYDELHRRASRYLARERSDHTLQATALVHEAYLRLIDQNRVHWRSTLHFVALSARMMRRILIDHARSHAVEKRGGGAKIVPLDDARQPEIAPAPDVLAVDEALNELAAAEPDLAKLVELRYFGGLSNDETAEVLEISVPTVVRRWRVAKAWLYDYLSSKERNGD